ncbi:hypothetical protein [Leptolyngbya sp. FACHB-261]|uniref:hypothetical protein n=1 Tax=Leptolyngbya sp. FACHB-261 TaxID=2692806 RepID=UPI001F54CDDA|nr:hypothetical protein [Leptolyngbya sp. FACHB-261]
MRDKSDRYRVEVLPLSRGIKRIGSYLLDAGLLTQAQIEVVLNDQKITGMRFGEIVAQRGWVKEQTIEYLMKKVVLPERQALKTSQPSEPTEPLPRPSSRRTTETPSISKPLTSNPLTDKNNDVSWVG